MQLAVRMDHREIELHTGGSLWVKTTGREIHVTRDSGAHWLPHLESAGEGAWLWTGFGLRVARSRPEVPRKLGR